MRKTPHDIGSSWPTSTKNSRREDPTTMSGKSPVSMENPRSSTRPTSAPPTGLWRWPSEKRTGGGIRRLQTQEFGSLFLANLLEEKIGACKIIDSVLPRKKGEKGPGMGEYFLFSAFNRMIQPLSKKALPEWLKGMAVQEIRPVDTQSLNSEAYWRKWDRVTEEDLLLAWRTGGVFWGKERTVVVTYNPLTASKKRYRFEQNLLKVQEELFAMRSRVVHEEPHWRNPETVTSRYEALCESLFLPKNLYDLELYRHDGRLRMSFGKNYYQINKYLKRFGKNIIITSHHDWDTDEIVRASLDRYKV